MPRGLPHPRRRRLRRPAGDARECAGRSGSSAWRYSAVTARCTWSASAALMTSVDLYTNGMGERSLSGAKALGESNAEGYTGFRPRAEMGGLKPPALQLRFLSHPQDRRAGASIDRTGDGRVAPPRRTIVRHDWRRAMVLNGSSKSTWSTTVHPGANEPCRSSNVPTRHRLRPPSDAAQRPDQRGHGGPRRQHGDSARGQWV